MKHLILKGYIESDRMRVTPAHAAGEGGPGQSP